MARAKAVRLGKGRVIFSTDLPAACKDMNGDMWYPDAVRASTNHKPSPKAQAVIDDSMAALSVCSTCPIQKTCLQAAIDNREEYGIWGGTFPYERHAVAPYEKTTDLGFIWQEKLRGFAEKKGLSCPPIPKPRDGYTPAASFWSYLQSSQQSQ